MITHGDRGPEIHDPTYIPDYLDATTADALLDWLRHGVVWRREHIKLFGKSIEVPRGVAWFGDAQLVYRYSGTDHVAHGWPDELVELRNRLGASHGITSNFVLLNRYETGQRYMGWHSDDEPETTGRIASVSFGATRRFLLRSSGTRPQARCQPRTRDQPRARNRAQALDLEHGSLLLLDPCMPHALPKSATRDERINLTFRRLAPPGRS